MIEHKYILEPYKGMNTRYNCPECNKGKTFSLYIDTTTGEHLHPTAGRCNRESNCGYHYTPKQYFQDNNISFDAPQPKAYKPRPITPPQKTVSFISFEVFKASLKAHDENHFVKFLISLFGVEVTNELISKYFIATSKHWNGSTVFWQIDTKGKVRTGKIMLYNPSTGKRVKNIEQSIYWVHKAIKQPEFELKQCFFGEHLLIDKVKPVAIVESEKTAVIGSIYLPQFIWLACGGLDNLNAEKCSILNGRNVTLFPDLKGFDKWKIKAKELGFNISDLIERKATEEEKQQGLDLADYLIRFDYKEFEFLLQYTRAKEEFTITEAKPIILFEQAVSIIDINRNENWEQNIIELENFFKEITLPTQPVKLNQCSTITNVSLFVESSIATVKENNGKQSFLPYLHRLHELKSIIQSSLII